ncbi:MAG: hypothetical protein KGP28_11185 [Bdellovibrionales bacterium]|nr:hypothetical protein [Bdellovibrionales bacterium]
MKRLCLNLSNAHFWLFLLLAFRFSCVGTLAQAEDVIVAESVENSFRPERVIQVTVAKEERQAEGIRSVLWYDSDGRVVTRYFGSSSESSLSLKGRIDRESPHRWHVIWNEKSFDVSPKGEFSLVLPFDVKLKNLELALVGPKGEVEYHFYRLKLDMPAVPVQNGGEVSFADFSDVEFNQKLKRKLFVSPGLGISNLNYSQTAVDPYNSIVMTAKISANYFIVPPKWDLGFTGFFNFVSLAKSSPVDVRFLGLNLRLGYIFPEVKAPWRLSLYGGWYYSTMFASDSSFGYKNVSGPQLFPSVRRTLNNGHALSAFLKFSPISNNLGLLSLSNNEFATGVSYLIPSTGHTYSISLDYARISFSDSEITIGSNSISLGGGVTF